MNRLVEPGKALDEALLLAEEILRNGPLALAASKRMIARSGDWSDEEAWQMQKPIAAVAMDLEDPREGVRAFAEKRRPAWRGR